MSNRCEICGAKDARSSVFGKILCQYCEEAFNDKAIEKRAEDDEDDGDF